jgi:hypothetical protein
MNIKTTLAIAATLISSTSFADTSVFIQQEQSVGKDSYVGVRLEAPLSDSDKAVNRMFKRDSAQSEKSSVQLYGQIDIGYQYSK